MGAPKKADWREERRKRAWKLKEQGWQQKDIAGALGVSELSSLGFLGRRKGKTRSICYADEEMNISLISKEKMHVLPGSMIVMETGGVNRLCTCK
jgi:transposase